MSNSPGHGTSPWRTSDSRASGHAFPTSGPAMATMCTPSSPATTSRCAASRSRTTRSCPAIPMPMSALHALTDALLGALARRRHRHAFPAVRSAMERGCVADFVEHAARLVRARGGRIANADITLICEAPRVGPHREAMRRALRRCRHLRGPHLDQGDNQQKLGFVGREEGIAAIATARWSSRRGAGVSDERSARMPGCSRPARSAASCWQRRKAARAA